jgi:LL-diaminopimelate aminotransferase
MVQLTSPMCPVKANSRLNDLPIYVFAWLDELKEQARARGANLVDLGMGSPDRPIPKPIIDVIKQTFDTSLNIGYPPFKGTDSFRNAVSAWMKSRHGVDIDPKTEVLCLSGSKEGLAHLSMAYIDQSDISLVPEIYYPVLSRATWLVGGDVHHLPMSPENDFLADFSNVPAEILERTRLLFLNYPNNPTGAVANMAYYQKAVEFCKKHSIVLVSDLAYAETVYDGYRAPSIFEIPGAKDIAVEFHSFSKNFNMAGARIGFAVGNPGIIHNLYSFRTNVGYGTPVAIQEGAVYAMNNPDLFLEEVTTTYKERRDAAVEGLRSLGWQVDSPKATLYLWLKVPRGFTSQDWTRHLIDTADVVVTPGNAFGKGGEGYFRISLVSPKETLIEAIGRLRKNQIRFEA